MINDTFSDLEKVSDEEFQDSTQVGFEIQSRCQSFMVMGATYLSEKHSLNGTLNNSKGNL